MRVPLAVDLHINKFNGAAITDKDSGITNGVVEKRGDTFYVTQRPSIDVFEDASVTVSDARGRAIYYWDGNSALYFANNDTIYKTAYGTTVGTVSSGTKKCKFLVMGTTLLFLDAENDQGLAILPHGMRLIIWRQKGTRTVGNILENITITSLCTDQRLSSFSMIQRIQQAVRYLAGRIYHSR